MMKRLIMAAAVSALLLVAVGCKPTEANYKAAYEAAQAGRNAQPEFEGMILEGGPRWHRVGEDSVLLLRHSMARLEGDTARLHPFNVAVGAYGMLTNASAHVDRLREAGYDSRVLRDGDQKYYAIAAQFDSIQPTVPFIDKYMREHPSDMYAGLPHRPVVEIPLACRGVSY